MAGPEARPRAEGAPGVPAPHPRGPTGGVVLAPIASGQPEPKAGHGHGLSPPRKPRLGSSATNFYPLAEFSLSLCLILSFLFALQNKFRIKDLRAILKHRKEFRKLAVMFRVSINAFNNPPDIIPSGAELYSRSQVFHAATLYAVYEDKVGGSSVTICTDLRLFRIEMVQCQ